MGGCQVGGWEAISIVREALRVAITEEWPARQVADLRTASGIALKPNEIPERHRQLNQVTAVSDCQLLT
jgi:hypothetical protein